MVWSQITQVAILLSCLVGLGRGEPPHVSHLRRRWQFGNKIIWDECSTVVHSFIFNKHVDLWVQLESHDSELLSQTYNPSLLAEAAAGFCLSVFLLVCFSALVHFSSFLARFSSTYFILVLFFFAFLPFWSLWLSVFLSFCLSVFLSSLMLKRIFYSSSPQPFLRRASGQGGKECAEVQQPAGGPR